MVEEEASLSSLATQEEKKDESPPPQPQTNAETGLSEILRQPDLSKEKPEVKQTTTQPVVPVQQPPK